MMGIRLLFFYFFFLSGPLNFEQLFRLERSKMNDELK